MHPPETLERLIALREEARHLNLASRGRQATRSGGHLSRFRGRGMEFDESRVYQPGDDPRHMDWRVTARAGVPHVKLFCEERERPVWLAADLGPSMRFGTRVAFKSTIAAQALALLAWAAADRGDRVGGLIFDETRHVEQRPAARTRGVLPLLKALAEDLQSGEVGGHPSLAAAASQLVPRVRPGSLVFLLSDFAGLRETESVWLTRLTDDSEVVLVQIHDPLEAHPPPPGRYPVGNGQRFARIDTHANHARAAWEARFAGQSQRLEALAQRHRAHLISLCTDQPVGSTLAMGLRPRGVGRMS
ncbi:MAG: DUF58 domain-containing protein [Pseudomonadota bacterium]